MFSPELQINNHVMNTRFLCDHATRVLKSGDARQSLVDLQEAFSHILLNVFRESQMQVVVHSDHKNWARISRRVELIMNSLALRHSEFHSVITPLDLDTHWLEQQQQVIDNTKEE